jgi:hypothetical protein
MRRAFRELAAGTTLALALGGVATAVMSSTFDEKPHFTSPTDSSAGRVDDGSELQRPSTVFAAPARTPAERRLVKVFEPFDLARESASAYSVVTFAQLGKQFPEIGFVRGDRPSQRASEVSLLVATPETIVLATVDDDGCTWLHELGGGPELAHSESKEACAASTPPLDGWTPITATPLDG